MFRFLRSTVRSSASLSKHGSQTFACSVGPLSTGRSLHLMQVIRSGLHSESTFCFFPHLGGVQLAFRDQSASLVNLVPTNFLVVGFFHHFPSLYSLSPKAWLEKKSRHVPKRGRLVRSGSMGTLGYHGEHLIIRQTKCQ